MEFESSTSEHTEVPNDYQVDMISTLQNIKVLLPEYENATLPGFQLGIHNLDTKYKKFRRVRGDGNCFYRSCLFGYLEGLLTKHIEGSLKEIADIERKRMLKTITDSKEELIQFGYSEIAIESFYDVTLEVLENLFNYSLEQLLESFQESGLSDYYTWYMRLLTSLNMKKNVEKYLPFIDDVDINSYCLREVEPMGKEVEMMMVMSLTEYLGIKLKVEYLDGKYEDDNKLPCVVFNVDETKKEENEFDVYLLYRPGHYDILYL